jgi:hypothetical protein
VPACDEVLLDAMTSVIRAIDRDDAHRAPSCWGCVRSRQTWRATRVRRSAMVHVEEPDRRPAAPAPAAADDIGRRQSRLRVRVAFVTTTRHLAVCRRFGGVSNVRKSHSRGRRPARVHIFGAMNGSADDERRREDRAHARQGIGLRRVRRARRTQRDITVVHEDGVVPSVADVAMTNSPSARASGRLTNLGERDSLRRGGSSNSNAASYRPPTIAPV